MLASTARRRTPERRVDRIENPSPLCGSVDGSVRLPRIEFFPFSKYGRSAIPSSPGPGADRTSPRSSAMGATDHLSDASVFPLSTIDPAAALDDLEPLARMIGDDVRIVALGES